ncbi:hypothetical protein PSU4_11140 [Pseudonocardia sulfidoxydans NBRC 16205]|uniref:DUF5667 domain-containing protein n=1 Tax=Pseudonocardia sulfidoxydans NBRC 16205 TaxID=1223511 RepID=A0A511DBH7_9PSEU|nr:DUF5667 domain-containing protein [Pseudonocardia sulfidoxydans]GEL22160.1 hypothetical protein PSU4_11140 [Pseudonocardia sulfidoxydans NBRC 16205]
MPAGQGKDPQRYAAWEESGSPLDPPVEDEFEHELALAAALDRSLPSLSPTADESARMQARMEAMLAQLGGGPSGPPPGPRPGPPRAAFASPFPESATERTTRIERIRDDAPPASPAAPTVRREPTQAFDAADLMAEVAAAGVEEQPTPSTASSSTSSPVSSSGKGDETDDDAAADAGHTPTVARRRRARHTLPRGYKDRPDNAGGSTRPTRPSGRRRIGIVAGAALFVMVALTGGGMLVSQNALPGDSLYGVKRAAESFGSVFTFGSDAKARRQIDLASARLTEIEQLAARGSNDPAVLSSAIDDFDNATSEGSRLVLAGAEGAGPAGLSDLHTWATQSSARLTSLKSTLPQPADADHSIELLDRVADRSAKIQSRMACSDVSDGSDDLGPIPANGACTPRTESDGSTGGSPMSARAGSSQTQSNSSSGTQTASATPESGAATTDGTGAPGLLPDLGADGLPLTDSTTDSGQSAGPSTTTSAPAQRGLLPPITLPPLLPGTSGITLGG